METHSTQKQRRSPMEETLVSLGFQKNYIGRAFKVYEKNYGFSYNIEVMTEIIVRLQNKDKLKLNISNRHQYQKAPQIQQSKTSDDNVDNIPPFVSHLTLKEASKLRIHDKIDHRDQVGRFVFGTISEKKGTNLKIHYDGWMSKKWDTWSDFSLEIHRFARADSISKRPAHRFRHLKKGDYVDINPTQRHPGWKCGEIRRLDQKSGQIQVVYEAVDNKNYLYWAHLDNVNEIAEFTAKSGTVVDKDNIKQDEKWNPPDLMPESVQISDSNYIDAYISNTFEYCHQSEASYTLNILEIILNLQI
eukprot:456913_1